VVAELGRNTETVIKTGVIQTPPSSTQQAKNRNQSVGELDWARAKKLSEELHSTLTTNNICHVYVECPTGGSKSSRAAKAMALAKGSAAATCASLGLDATLFTPQQAKRAATGSNKATKSEVKAAALKEFSYYDDWVRNSKGRLVKGQNEHIFDACSVLMCARRTKSYKEIIQS
jgi:Holliday junction resolvasome RuvABC endonuclease subunit